MYLYGLFGSIYRVSFAADSRCEVYMGIKFRLTKKTPAREAMGSRSPNPQKLRKAAAKVKGKVKEKRKESKAAKEKQGVTPAVAPSTVATPPTRRKLHFREEKNTVHNIVPENKGGKEKVKTEETNAKAMTEKEATSIIAQLKNKKTTEDSDSACSADGHESSSESTSEEDLEEQSASEAEESSQAAEDEAESSSQSEEDAEDEEMSDKAGEEASSETTDMEDESMESSSEPDSQSEGEESDEVEDCMLLFCFMLLIVLWF